MGNLFGAGNIDVALVIAVTMQQKGVMQPPVMNTPSPTRANITASAVRKKEVTKFGKSRDKQ